MVCQFQNSGSSPGVQLIMKKDAYHSKIKGKNACCLQMSQNLQLPSLTGDAPLTPWHPYTALVATTVMPLKLKIQDDSTPAGAGHLPVRY